jgi:hypothetical protein
MTPPAAPIAAAAGEARPRMRSVGAINPYLAGRSATVRPQEQPVPEDEEEDEDE